MVKISRERFIQILREEVEYAINNLVIDAPSNKKPIDNSGKVFLAGTIDADTGSEDWQHKICKKIEDTTDNKYRITIY